MSLQTLVRCQSTDLRKWSNNQCTMTEALMLYEYWVASSQSMASDSVLSLVYLVLVLRL